MMSKACADCSADSVCNDQCAAGEDPDCEPPAPTCEADGICYADCAAGTDPDCNSCQALGTICTDAGDCCSNKCKGKYGAKTCK